MMVKTPIRKNPSPPNKKTPQAAKEFVRKSIGNRQSGVKPFNRIDTNLHQSSSRKTFKQTSSQSKKQQEFQGLHSFRNSMGTTPFTSNNEQKHLKVVSKVSRKR